MSGRRLIISTQLVLLLGMAILISWGCQTYRAIKVPTGQTIQQVQVAQAVGKDVETLLGLANLVMQVASPYATGEVGEYLTRVEPSLQRANYLLGAYKSGLALADSGKVPTEQEVRDLASWVGGAIYGASQQVEGVTLAVPKSQAPE